MRHLAAACPGEALRAGLATALREHDATIAVYAVLAALDEEPGLSNADLPSSSRSMGPFQPLPPGDNRPAKGLWDRRVESRYVMSNLERNKQVVVDYYQMAFGGNPEKAIADHFGPRYIQHNPDAQDGPGAFIGYVTWLRGKYPDVKLYIKRVLAEGDMVVTHSHLDLEPGNPDNPGRALADFFRLENGKVVEHWDVTQDIPVKSANDNGMF